MEGGQYRGLPIDITGINIDTLDTTATPLNGMHYLCQVRKQADQMPSIHVSTNRDALIRKTFNNQQKSLYHVDEVKSISKNYLPTQRWIDAFIKEFTNKREHMEDYLSSITPNSRGYFHKPHYSDIRGWKKVCYGYQKKSPLENREDILYHGKDDALSDNIFVSKDETPTIYPEQSTLFSNINTKTTTNQPIKNEKQPRYPYEGYICDLAFLQTLDQKCITSLLAHFAMFLKTSINQRECEWLLGLMMAVTELMTSDELNGIRMLVKKCRTIREILVDKGDGVNKDENNEVGRSDGYIENRIDIESRNEIEAESGEEGEENESNCAQIGNTTTSLGLDVGIVGLNMVIAIGSIIFRQSDLGDVYPE